MKTTSMTFTCWPLALWASLSLHAQSTFNIPQPIPQPTFNVERLNLTREQVDHIFGNQADTYQASLGQIIAHFLRIEHFQNRPLDDEISAAAFEIYIERLDSRKIFLTTNEVKLLEVHRTEIDDQISSGHLALLDSAEELRRVQIERVRAYVQERMERPFNLETRRMFEANPEKRILAPNMEQLYLSWDDILTVEIIGNYLDLEQEKGNEDIEEQDLQEQAIARTRERYLGDFGFFSNILDQDHNDRLGRFFSSITNVYDPHTNYLPPRRIRNHERSSTGTYYGVGFSLAPGLDGRLRIMEVYPGSPSWKTKKIKVGDIILKVGQGDQPPVNAEGMKSDDLVTIVMGPQGTEVRLTVKHEDGSIEEVPIIRDKIVKEDAYVQHFVLQNRGDEKKWGYIKLPSFYDERVRDQNGDYLIRSSTADVTAALTQLKGLGVSGIILDIRDNSGGTLVDAENISELFVNGPIIQAKYNDGSIDVFGNNTPATYHGPLVILVNRDSASASDIVATVLQDYVRALVVGVQTHGKGSIQAWMSLDEGTIKEIRQSTYHQFGLPPQVSLGTLQLTYAQFCRVTGEPVQSFGAIPDIILPDKLSYIDDLGEGNMDFALSAEKCNPALAALEFEAASHTFDIQELQRKSQERVRKSEPFQKIIEEAQFLRERSENTEYVISLQAERSNAAEFKEKSAQFVSSSFNQNMLISYASIDDENLPPEHGQEWREKLQKDAQLGEAMAILDDLISSSDENPAP